MQPEQVQRRGNPDLLLKIDEPFHRQLVPAEVLDTLLGEERQALVSSDPLQRGPRVIGARRLLSGQFRQSRCDLRILALIHRNLRLRASRRGNPGRLATSAAPRVRVPS
jgi:hypothetical protein